MTRWPPVLSSAVSAEPTRPVAPVTATTSGAVPAIGGVAVGGEVVGELAVPVDERRSQRGAGHGRLDPVVHPGPRQPSFGDVLEVVGVPPSGHQARRKRRKPVRRQHVDEAARRVVTGRIVLRHPAQPTGQPEDRLPVGQRIRLGHHRHRLPRRNQPPHGAGAGVPGEDLVQRMVDHALELDAHDHLFVTERPSDGTAARMHPSGGRCTPNHHRGRSRHDRRRARPARRQARQHGRLTAVAARPPSDGPAGLVAAAPPAVARRGSPGAVPAARLEPRSDGRPARRKGRTRRPTRNDRWARRRGGRSLDGSPGRRAPGGGRRRGGGRRAGTVVAQE